MLNQYMLERFRSMDEKERRQILTDLIIAIAVGTVLGFLSFMLIITMLVSFGAL